MRTMNTMKMRATGQRLSVMLAAVAAAALLGAEPAAADDAAAGPIRAAAVYTQPVTQKWVRRLHEALSAAQRRGEIEYVFSEQVASGDDYVRALREYAASGVALIVGEAFGIGAEARQVADDHPGVAFLMGDSRPPHGANFAVFDNYLHEACYLMGLLAGSMTATDRIGMVGGYPIGEVNRLFHAFMAGARSVNPAVEFKVAFIDSWYDPPQARAAALAQVAAGVDVLYAERAGVVDAARESGIIAFGSVTDMNREENGRGVVVTSALWDMNPAIGHAVQAVREGRFEAADYREWTMMAKGGARLAPYYEFEERIPAAAKALVEEIRADILAGRRVVEIDDAVPESTY